jgi:hypothetical protein
MALLLQYLFDRVGEQFVVFYQQDLHDRSPPTLPSIPQNLKNVLKIFYGYKKRGGVLPKKNAAGLSVVQSIFRAVAAAKSRRRQDIASGKADEIQLGLFIKMLQVERLLTRSPAASHRR